LVKKVFVKKNTMQVIENTTFTLNVAVMVRGLSEIVKVTQMWKYYEIVIEVRSMEGA